MNYLTYNADDSLSDFIKCFWSLEGEATPAPEKQVIIPDGCMEMIFHYGDLYRQYRQDGSYFLQPRSFVFGQVTSVLEIAPSGKSGIIAARFQPDGFAPFATLPVQDMENKAVSLDTLFGQDGVQLTENVLAASTTEERIGLITRFLLSRIQSQALVDRVVRSSVEVLLKLKGGLSVEELAEQTDVHRRKLERRFASTIGLSPKQLSRMIRLQTTLKMLDRDSPVSMAALACENGYFDQAHFIRDFREFTGTTPQKFYSDNLKMSALFVGSD